MSGRCEGVCTSGTMGCALVRGSTRDIRRGEWVQKALIFMRFHGGFLGNQHEIWSKQHNGKVRKFWQRFRLPVPPSMPGMEVSRVPASSRMLKHGLEGLGLVAKNPLVISAFMSISPGGRMNPGREH